MRQKVVADINLGRRPAGSFSGSDALREPRSVFRRDLVPRGRERGRRGGKVSVKEVDLRRLRVDDHPVDGRQPGGEVEGTLAVCGHFRELHVQAHRRRRNEGMKLDQSAAMTAPPDPRLGDKILGTQQHRTGERADAFVEGHVDRVERGAKVGQRLRRKVLSGFP